MVQLSLSRFDISIKSGKINKTVTSGQWGSPTFSAAAVFGMLAGVIAGAIESVGDYYACAQFCRIKSFLGDDNIKILL